MDYAKLCFIPSSILKFSGTLYCLTALRYYFAKIFGILFEVETSSHNICHENLSMHPWILNLYGFNLLWLFIYDYKVRSWRCISSSSGMKSSAVLGLNAFRIFLLSCFPSVLLAIHNAIWNQNTYNIVKTTSELTFSKRSCCLPMSW